MGKGAWFGRSAVGKIVYAIARRQTGVNALLAHAQSPGDFAHPTQPRLILTHLAGNLEDEHQHLGHRLVELDWNLVADLDF